MKDDNQSLEAMWGRLNAKDYAKKHNPHQHLHRRQKLTVDQAREIRRDAHLGPTRLAKKYSVSYYVIWALLAGRTYREIESA
jgi:hypothetical protein